MLDGVDHQFRQSHGDGGRAIQPAGQQNRQGVGFPRRSEDEAALGQQQNSAGPFRQFLLHALKAGEIVRRPAHDGDQNINVIGFGQVVVDPRLDAVDDLGLKVHRRLHDHRNILQNRIALDLGKHFHAVHFGHFPVEENGVVLYVAGGQHGPGLGTVAGLVDHEALRLQAISQGLTVEILVIDNQDPDIRHAGFPAASMVIRI